MRFDAAWLEARGPYDEAALDACAVEAIKSWAGGLPHERQPVVVDLGSGTGAALGRVRRWLAPRSIVAYAVDRDRALLERAGRLGPCQETVPLVGDLLDGLQPLGGPADGTVDLVVGHALADLLPLDRLAGRVAALLRPGGLGHLALAYDGLTCFEPVDDVDLERTVVAAFHRHMDWPAATDPSYGGSTAGRRLGPALARAGLQIVTDAPSVWTIRADGGDCAQRVLARLIRFVVEAVREIGGVPCVDLAGWEARRQANLASGSLAVCVGHRDVLVRAPTWPYQGSQDRVPTAVRNSAQNGESARRTPGDTAWPAR